MERRIIEKYAELNKACEQYPIIELSSLEERGGYVNRNTKPKTYQKPENFAKGGFKEKFCLYK